MLKYLPILSILTIQAFSSEIRLFVDADHYIKIDGLSMSPKYCHGISEISSNFNKYTKSEINSKLDTLISEEARRLIPKTIPHGLEEIYGSSVSKLLSFEKESERHPINQELLTAYLFHKSVYGVESVIRESIG